MDRDYWIGLNSWNLIGEQFYEDMVLNTYFQFWQCQQWWWQKYELTGA